MIQKPEKIILHAENGKESTILEYPILRKSVLILRAINHKLRQQIIALLEESNELTVTDIYVKLRIEQSVASQHLAILRRAGVVQTERKGKNIKYSINNKRITDVEKLVEELCKQ